MVYFKFLPALVLLLSACSPQPEAPVETPIKSPVDLAGFFDCVREEGRVLISAHRGGPIGDYPENAIETFAHNVAAGPVLLEVDVRQSTDGVLFLYHDDDLGRASTGSGPVSGLSWAELSRSRLLDVNGQQTDFSIPTLEAALLWAKDKPAILQLDIKPGAPYQDVTALLRQTGMTGQIVMISYSAAQARAFHNLAPSAMLSISAGSGAALDQLLQEGFPADRALGWMGIGTPEAGRVQHLSALGIEPIVASMGALDRRLASSNSDDEYVQFIGPEAVILATDRTFAVRAALQRDDGLLDVCPFPVGN